MHLAIIVAIALFLFLYDSIFAHCFLPTANFL
jgi:hypothetical protein